MGRGAADPNALAALTQLKLEIANELGIEASFGQKDGSMTTPGANVFKGGKIGGSMTKRMVEMAEKGMLDKE